MEIEFIFTNNGAFIKFGEHEIPVDGNDVELMGAILEMMRACFEAGVKRAKEHAETKKALDEAGFPEGFSTKDMIKQ